MNKKIIVIIAILVISAISYMILSNIFILDNIPLEEKNFHKEKIKWQGDMIIGHAFFEVDGSSYTNSKEAFEEGYSKGVRTFEVDMYITTDNKIVLTHYFDEGKELSQKEFLETKILDKYTPMSLSDLFKIMKEYPDIYIVTDTKYTDKETIEKQFNEIIRVSKELNVEDLLDRFIIQIYSEEMYDFIGNIYKFDDFIYTIYQRGEYGGYSNLEDFENVCKWSKEHGVNSIAMAEHVFQDDAMEISKKYDIDIYVHTINNLDTAKDFIKRGAKGIYTDNILEEQIKESI